LYKLSNVVDLSLESLFNNFPFFSNVFNLALFEEFNKLATCENFCCSSWFLSVVFIETCAEFPKDVDGFMVVELNVFVQFFTAEMFVSIEDIAFFLNKSTLGLFVMST